MSGTFDAAVECQRLTARVQDALAQAKRRGATACEVAASASQNREISVRKGEVVTLSQSRDQSIGITVYRGKRQGSASTSDTRPQAILAAIEKACDIARFTEEDQFAGLADASLMAQTLPDMAQFHPWAITTDDAIQRAQACEQAGLDLPGIRNSEGATCQTASSAVIYGNSHGFVGTQQRTQHGMSCVLIAGEGDGMQRDYEYTSALDPRHLADAATVGRLAAEKALARLGSIRPKTGCYPVVMSPAMARTLIGHFMSAIAGGALYREASFLLDALGDPVFPAWFSLYEQPQLRGGLASSPFDDDGVFTRDNRFVERGILSSYMLSSYSARRLGMVTTGNAGGAHNMRIDAPLVPYADLIGGIEKGVLITELMGQGVNTVTGDYSRGSAGFWIENGKIAYPVENFTVAGNLRDMFRSVQAVGDDIDTRSHLHTGSWLLDGMTIAS